MTIASVDHLPARPGLHRLHAIPTLISRIRTIAGDLRVFRKKLLLAALSVLLLCASIGAYHWQTSLLAGRNTAQNCNWHTVESGDTLSNIAWHSHSTISILARANAIRNLNLIFVGQRLCIPHGQANATGGGVTPNGVVRWYAYNALGWSNRPQVRQLLYQTAAAHHLPPKLLLAIAWQESGWTQHVIAWDGGIGVMQLMPYTAMGVNSGIGQQLDPYDLQDNLDLGATYLQWLWQDFHGNLPQVISAYNEGGWAVKHCGIYNWRYVNNVLALMRNLD